MQDMMLKGRGNKPRGEQVGGAKLTESDVREIRVSLAEGECTQAELGRRFGVDIATISDIKRGNTWRHVTLDDVEVLGGKDEADEGA